MSKIALYRKYRSKDFSDLYGQEHITTTLKNAVKSGNFGHAYLFFGPRGTGKTSMARILAKAINCEHPKDGNPDNTCDKCQLIDAGKAVDIIEIDAASHTQVDNIREVIIERAKFAPTNLKYKVYIIDEAHMLSKSSFNALLKTLEEPPEHTIFILATTEINKIVPTIQSRCQRFDFRRVTEKIISERLAFIAKSENIDITENALAMIAGASEGGFRDAISLLDQVADGIKSKIDTTEIEQLLGISGHSSVIDFVFAVVNKDAKAALELLSKMVESGYEPNQLFKDILTTLRKLVIAKSAGITEVGLSKTTEKTVSELLEKTTTEDLVRLIDTFVENDTLYKSSGLYQLSLEVATIKVCVGYSVPTVATATKPVAASSKSAPTPKAAPTKAITNKWQHFLLEVKGRNNSVYAILRVCEPDFNENEVTLSFPYKFHKERIEDMRNRAVVEDTLQKVYGEKYRVKCVLKPSMTPSQTASNKTEISDDLLDDAINIFGGEVVE